MEHSRYVLPGKSVSFITSYDIDFPEEGVINSVGYLFHHFLPFTLNDEHHSRLIELGIKPKFNKRFTHEEDERIRLNWRRFAEKHDLRYEDARVYAGFMDSFDGNAKLARRQNDALVRLGMWPRICRKLEDRSAKQIQNRIMYIFDPHYVGKPDLISFDQIIDAYGRLGDGENVVDIAMDMRVPYTRLLTAMSAHKCEWKRQGLKIEDIIENPSLLDKVKLKEKDLHRFYDVVLLESGLSDDFLRHAIFEDRENYKDTIKTKMEDFNWVRLIPKFSKLNDKTLKKSWWSLLKKLARAFWQELDSNFVGNKEATISETAKEDAWSVAVTQTMPFVQITVSHLKLFSHALSRCANKNFSILHGRYLDIKRLKRKLIKYGMAENNYNLKECKIFPMISHRIARWSRDLFDHLDFPLNIRDKLRIAVRCFERLSSERGDVPDDSHSVFPISRVNLVENTIKEILELCEGEWTAPRVLRKYVTDCELIDAFTGRRSGLVDEEREKRIFRKSVFDDTKCMRAPVFNPIMTKIWASKKSAIQHETQGDFIIYAPSKKGWAQPSTSAEESGREPVVDTLRSPTPVERESSYSEEDESFENITMAPLLSDTILAGHNMSQHQNNNRSLTISPIKRQRDDSPHVEEALGEEEEEEDVLPGGKQNFSHLLVSSSQPPPKRRRPAVEEDTANSWLDIFS